MQWNLAMQLKKSARINIFYNKWQCKNSVNEVGMNLERLSESAAPICFISEFQLII